MKYGLRAPAGTTEGIWIDTASENSDGGAAAGVVSANGSCGAPPAGACPGAVGATAASPNGLLASGALPAGAPGACSSSSGGTGSDGPFFPVFSAVLSCH